MSPPPGPTVAESAAPAADHAEWFRREVLPHQTSLQGHLRGAFSGLRDVDDVVQESYLRIWKARAVHPIQSAKAFLFRTARNLALDLLRRDRATPVTLVMDYAALPVLDDRPGVAELTCAREEVVLLARAIDALPARCREVVILRKLQGISQKEIAARLNITESTVQVQVARGMKRCDQYLREHGVTTLRP